MNDLPWLDPAILPQVVRIDLGLEGDWSNSVTCVWDREEGYRGLPDALPVGRGLRPCLELYMEGGWIGIHCFVEHEGAHVLDRERARSLVEAVDRAAGG